MRRFATLLAVDDGSRSFSFSFSFSLTGELALLLFELLFPNPSFHLLGFFVIVGDTCVCVCVCVCAEI